MTDVAIKDATLTGCRCLACGADGLERIAATTIACAGCGVTYDIHDEIPCLVRYQDDEALSLIEILSNVGEARTPPSSATYRYWWEMLERVHASVDPEATITEVPEAYRQFLPHRYRQYRIFKDLTQSVDFAGAEVLDLGAGEGFDAAMLAFAGAKVTAAEFNPLLCALGRHAVEARWIAASAHALPFANESFDHVVCQATLHHMADVPQAMKEALRVLRPGGSIFTISDSYRPDAAGEDFEWRRFDRDPAVLRGVNESIPRFGDFVAALTPHAPNLDVIIQTSRVFSYIDPETGKRGTLETPRTWRFPEDVETLSKTSGGVSFRIRKLRSLAIERTRPCRPAVRPRDFLGGAKEASMAKLARRIPRQFCDSVFPGPVGNTKFDLLNGWMQRGEGEDYRRGYHRARRFVTRRTEDTQLALRLASEIRQQQIFVLIDGVEQAQVEIAPGSWTEVVAPLAATPVGQPFSVELQLTERAEQFDDNVFRVAGFQVGAGERE